MNVLLFIHIVISILLVAVILLQQTGTDSLSGIGGKSSGFGSARTASDFLTKTTIVLATLFFINSLILANLSVGKNKAISKKMDEPVQAEKSLPIK